MEEVFGNGFRALFIFAYWLQTSEPLPADIVHVFRDQHYIFVGIPVEEYRLHARIRSPKWGTVNMPTAEFARRARPLVDWL